MGANPSSRANAADRAEEQVQAYNLRLRGLSLREIGRQMGCSHEKVRQLIALEADARVLPLADELRKQQLDRLNEMRLRALEVLEREHYQFFEGRVVRMKNGDGEPVPVVDDSPVLSAIDRLLKVEDRMSKLLGLDAPVQSEVTATVEHRPVEVLSLIEQARQRTAEEEAALREGRQRVEAEAREEHGPA
ncbi:hypothetical protein ABZ215_25080 [Amycolatopsis sp. NPDC006131]|uniref:hypothetical protein n=1 Tax=Amycolatopsis sp. NPDC006131 TaxID=3156731 RepID=UPI0033B4B600